MLDVPPGPPRRAGSPPPEADKEQGRTPASQTRRRLALLPAGLLLSLQLLIAGCGGPQDPSAAPVEPGTRTADQWTGALGTFMERGPTRGAWEVRRLATTQHLRVTPHPNRPDMVLIAVARPGSEAPREQAVSRWLVVRNFFFEAPPYLFFQNYERQSEPETEVMAEYGETVRVTWVPKAGADTLTQRRVWFHPHSQEVVQIEDLGRAGRTVRRVRRASDASPWDPHLDLLEMERCELPPPSEGEGVREDLVELARKAAFPLYAPSWLPPGFIAIRVTYQECDLSRSMAAGEDSADPTPVRIASLTYSDGLAILSIAAAEARDMDAMEALQRMSRELEDPASCPGLPAPTGPLVAGRAVVRVRTDACRTVMRRDDLPGVSVTLTGRNEIDVDDYLRVIESLTLVKAR